MAFKALVTGRRNSQHLADMFAHMSDRFEFLTTSDIWEDIIAHFNLFRPELFIILVSDVTPDIIAKIREVKRLRYASGIPFIAVTDEDGEEALRTGLAGLDIFIITRPISIPMLKEKMYEYMKSWLSEQAALKAEEEASRKAAEDARAVAEAEADAALHGENGRKNILIVDDDRSILKMLKAALEDTYNVTTMVSGKTAYKFLETKPVDLILLDYEMPVENGPEVLMNIRRFPVLAEIPVIFLTGVTDSSKIREVLQMKPQGYLLKPIDIHRLNSTISDVLAASGK